MEKFNFSFKINGDEIYFCYKNFKTKINSTEFESFLRSNGLTIIHFQNLHAETILNNTKYQFIFNEQIKSKKGKFLIFKSIPEFERGMTPCVKRTTVVFLPHQKARITTDWIKLKINSDTLEIEEFYHKKHIYIWNGENLIMEEK